MSDPAPRRFLFVLWEGGGNVPPQLGLAAGLVDRGHDVRVLTEDCLAADVAAALFNPLRIRIQHLVDRRFNRARYDAEATVAAFTARLRDAVEIDAIRADLLDAVNRAVQPTHASVWIRQRTPGQLG